MFADEKNPVLLYYYHYHHFYFFVSFHYSASTGPVLFKKCKCGITPRKKQCHILIKRSWHEQTATMTINKLLANKIKLCEQRILRIAYQTRRKQSVLGTN